MPRRRRRGRVATASVPTQARISRIVLNEGGHALLVGVGGSGKQSLSRLAAFICHYVVIQIVISSTYSISDLKEDLKVMYTKARSPRPSHDAVVERNAPRRPASRRRASCSC